MGMGEGAIMEMQETPAAGSFPLHSGRLSASLVPLLLAVVFFGGVGGRFSDEIYPIANWGMFSQTPSRSTVYTLVVHQLDGKPLVPPRLLMEVPELQAAFKSAKEAWRIRAVWNAMDARSEGKVAAERRNLEALFGKRKVIYELVRVECDPVAYLRDGKTIRETTYGLFESGKPLDGPAVKARKAQGRNGR